MDIDTNTLNAVRILDALGREVDALMGELERLLTNVGPPAVVSFGADEESTEDASYSSEGGWVWKGWRWTFPAKTRREGKGNRPKAGSLSVVVDLGRDGQPSRDLGYLCLIVAWAEAEDDWNEQLDGDEFWPAAADSYDLRAECLFWWTGSVEDGRPVAANRAAEPLAASWLYVVPLFAIKDRQKLGALVVNPVLELLSGKAPKQVFATTPEVARFKWKDGRAVPVSA
jgi:hypothetical protein